MRYGPEWMTCERLAEELPKRPKIDSASPSPFAHGPWAYDRDIGLRPRNPSDGGALLDDRVVDIFDALWQSNVLPKPEVLAEVLDANQVSDIRWVSSSPPRYWRCKVGQFELTYPHGTFVRYLVSSCRRVEGRISHLVRFEYEIPGDVVDAVEAIVPALLYEVADSPVDENDRVATFVEMRLGDHPWVRVFKERVSLLRNMESSNPDPKPQSFEHASLAEAIAVHGLQMAKVALVWSRDPSTTLAEVVQQEAKIRGIPLRYLEMRDDGLAFAGARSEYSGITKFPDLRDILAWSCGTF